MQSMEGNSPDTPSRQSLKRSDYLLLSFFGIVLFSGPLVCGRVLTGHESVVPRQSPSRSPPEARGRGSCLGAG